MADSHALWDTQNCNFDIMAVINLIDDTTVIKLTRTCKKYKLQDFFSLGSIKDLRLSII